jgi:glycine reductase
MSKIKVVHYINNFFAGIGGEEKADIPPEVREGVVGPGMALNKAFGDEAEVVATVICGDSYFNENEKEAKAEILEMIKKYNPDLFVAGPAFNAGRYGVACGTISMEVEKELNIPVISGMYIENPGADMFKQDMHIIETKISSADMRNTIPKMAKLGLKLAKDEIVGPPEEEGYIVRGIRTNYFHEKRASERAVEMLVKKLKDEEFVTEYPMPNFDLVEPAAPIKDFSKAKVALVTSGGIVPQGNPDRIESSSATKYGIYDITGMDSLSADKFTSIHGGYDRAYVLENPNLVIPLDVMRDLEKEGVIGELANYFVTTTGTGTAVNNAKGFGEEFSQKLVDDGIDAVVLTST